MRDEARNTGKVLLQDRRGQRDPRRTAIRRPVLGNGISSDPGEKPVPAPRLQPAGTGKPPRNQTASVRREVHDRGGAGEVEGTREGKEQTAQFELGREESQGSPSTPEERADKDPGDARKLSPPISPIPCNRTIPPERIIARGGISSFFPMKKTTR